MTTQLSFHGRVSHLISMYLVYEWCHWCCNKVHSLFWPAIFSWMHLNRFEHIATHIYLFYSFHLTIQYGRNKRWHVVPPTPKVFHFCIIPRRHSILSSYPLLYYPGRAMSTPIEGISRPLRPWLIIPHTLVLQGSSNVSHVIMIIQMPSSCRGQIPSCLRGLSSLHVTINIKDHRLLFPRGTKSLHLLLRQRTGSTRQNGARIFLIRASVDLVLDVTMSIVCQSFVRRVWCLPYHASLLWVLEFGKWINTVFEISGMDVFMLRIVCIWCVLWWCAYDTLICNTLFGIWCMNIWHMIFTCHI